MSTFGHPGRYTYCIGRERGSEPVAAISRGPRIAGHRVGRHVVRRRRAARHLGSFEPHRARARRIARLVDGWPLEQQTLSALLPHDAGSGSGARAHVRRRWVVEGRPQASPVRDGAPTVPTLLPDADHGEGTNLRFSKSETPREPDALISKFPSTEEIHVVVAGGTAGRFSVAIPGWLGTRNGSRPSHACRRINSIDLPFRSRGILPAGSGTHGVR